ncbi:Uncharacterized protein AB751O23_AE_00310 [Chlamydiales bacterium SCGC AB-751-O23]|jgi:nucleoside-diphosphate-sugar epimerase|nr:Uncharacterized protein AB751O23_AE_00310 [Chlamydiales bacterium SCGC AB-751-O23]
MNIFLLGTGYVGMKLLSSWKNPNTKFTATTTTDLKLKEIKSQKSTSIPLLLKIDKHSNISQNLNEIDILIITTAPKNNTSYEETYFETSESIKNSIYKRNKPLYLLYTSSTSVYGNKQERIVNEDDLRNPCSKTSQILCKTEDNYESLSNEYITICILRLGGIYGPNRTLESRARKMSEKEFSSTGNEPTNHIHLDDITNAIEYCVSHKLSGTYNLVNDDHPTRKNLYNKLCKTLELMPPRWKNSQNSGEVTNAVISNKKIKKAGFKLKNPLIDL